MPAVVVGGGVVAETVVDDPESVCLPGPDQWVVELVVAVFVQDSDVRLGLQLAVALIEDHEVCQPVRNGVLAGAEQDGCFALRRMHAAPAHPGAAEDGWPLGHGGQ
jgi:hypothetical protein